MHIGISFRQACFYIIRCTRQRHLQIINVDLYARKNVKNIKTYLKSLPKTVSASYLFEDVLIFSQKAGKLHKNK